MQDLHVPVDHLDDSLNSYRRTRQCSVGHHTPSSSTCNALIDKISTLGTIHPSTPKENPPAQKEHRSEKASFPLTESPTQSFQPPRFQPTKVQNSHHIESLPPYSSPMQSLQSQSKSAPPSQWSSPGLTLEKKLP